MANERDNAFTSTGIGGMGQSTDFDTASTGTSGTDRGAMNDGTGQSAPITARAKEAVSTAGHKAADRVQERIADQVTRATGQLESVASSLRTAGAQMPQDNGIGRYMVQAATQVDNLATFLNNREVGELVDEVEEFARRQPAVFIGGAFALGVLGARFLRSSRQNMGIDTDRGYRRSSFEDGYGDTSAGSTSYGRFGDTSQSNYGTGYGAGSTQAGSGSTSGGYGTGSTQAGSGLSSGGYGGGSTQGGSGVSSGGYGTGSSQSGSGYSSTTPGGTTGTNSGLGASSSPGSSSTSRDLSSDNPSGTRGFGNSTEGMSGSGTSRTGGFGSGSTASSTDRAGSLSSDDDTRTTGFGSDNLSARSDSGTNRDSLDSESDRKSPDFL